MLTVGAIMTLPMASLMLYLRDIDDSKLNNYSSGLLIAGAVMQFGGIALQEYIAQNTEIGQCVRASGMSA